MLMSENDYKVEVKSVFLCVNLVKNPLPGLTRNESVTCGTDYYRTGYLLLRIYHGTTSTISYLYISLSVLFKCFKFVLAFVYTLL